MRMMMMMAATGLSLALTASAAAQMQGDAPPPPMIPSMDGGAPANPAATQVLGAGALPGVGMRTTTSTERRGSGGPGGLSGGVGAAGVLAPGLPSGAPNATTATGSGLTFETTPGAPAR